TPGGASGLMQIRPGTATHTVKRFAIPDYRGPGQLLETETNINIGTSYWQYVYQQFGNNGIFATEAYNAAEAK
ncbi:transglycosylase SLT domain-containing protein, partial [Salmonella enterica]|uniref:transglycosylase SLT domain-containing protein n=1 Tax=Salmonella enterica TaxID=28901 RepID=UPI000ABDD45D